jgi:hypothetical protein
MTEVSLEKERQELDRNIFDRWHRNDMGSGLGDPYGHLAYQVELKPEFYTPEYLNASAAEIARFVRWRQHHEVMFFLTRAREEAVGSVRMVRTGIEKYGFSLEEIGTTEEELQMLEAGASDAEKTATALLEQCREIVPKYKALADFCNRTYVTPSGFEWRSSEDMIYRITSRLFEVLEHRPDYIEHIRRELDIV